MLSGVLRPGVSLIGVLLLVSMPPPASARQSGPEQFSVGVLNTPSDEYGPVFSPTGDEIYFTIRRNRSGSEYLAFSRRIDDSWSSPTALSFSGAGYDKEPFLSPDGSRLFFASTRPISSGINLEFEIWMVERRVDGWGEPQHLAEVGSPGYDNYPAVAANGNLYFGSDRIEGRGRIFRAVWNGTSYDQPVVMTTEGDVQLGGADPYIDPQERFMVFSSTRSGGFGEGDLYITVSREGVWSEPVNLGPVINTTSYEYTAFISPDRQYLYFSRDWGEMWRIPIEEVELLREQLGNLP